MADLHLWPWALIVGIYALGGLMIGSFLNVVIYRLPIMMERQWAQSIESHAGAPNANEPDPTSTSAQFNLLVPGSACPSCHTPLRWWHNLPVLSFLLQKGRCAACKAPISWRYPIVELCCSALFFACALHFGPGLVSLAWCGFCAVLIAAAAIDWDTCLLPDDLTLPLLWAGLLLSATHTIDLPLAQSVWGAAMGYLSLWSVFWLFKFATGKEGMGYGDFKLLAAMGAWLGPLALIPLTLVACIAGLALALPQLLMQRIQRDQPIPFGPALVCGGLLLAFSKDTLLRALGLVL